MILNLFLFLFLLKYLFQFIFYSFFHNQNRIQVLSHHWYRLQLLIKRLIKTLKLNYVKMRESY